MASWGIEGFAKAMHTGVTPYGKELNEELHITGWIDPAENVAFFLTTLYDALNRGIDKRPEMFDGAYLSCRYRNEYDVPDMPGFVKKVIMPVAYFIGKMTGKYNKFKDAPLPL